MLLLIRCFDALLEFLAISLILNDQLFIDLCIIFRSNVLVSFLNVVRTELLYLLKLGGYLLLLGFAFSVDLICFIVEYSLNLSLESTHVEGVVLFDCELEFLLLDLEVVFG